MWPYFCLLADFSLQLRIPVQDLAEARFTTIIIINQRNHGPTFGQQSPATGRLAETSNEGISQQEAQRSIQAGQDIIL